MIRIFRSWEEVDKIDLFAQVDKVLDKRADLWERYSRGLSFENYQDKSITKENLQILFEKFIVDIAAGYSAGEISYDVDVSSDVEKKIGLKIFNKDEVTSEYADELKYILNTLAITNDDSAEEIKLFKQAFLYGSIYERVLEDKNNKFRYHNLDALNTVAIWDNAMEPQLVAVVSKFEYKHRNNSVTYYYRVYLKDRIDVYSVETRQKTKDPEEAKIKIEDTKPHEWGEVPVVCYESDFSILDRCADLILSYEALLNNVRNTYQYNDTDCKMKIVGYRPKNPITIPDPKDPTKQIINPAREIEDNYVLSGKTFYVQEGGDADWLTKPIQANDVTTMLKYYVDSIFQMCGIPNTADLAFNSGDLNASAIDRKFYVMNIATSDIRDGVTHLLYDRFGLLIRRINLKYNTNYEMDNVTIHIATNLPSMTDETIDQMMRLNGILSEETILTKLGYDYETEKDRKEDEANETVAKTTRTNPEIDEEDEEEDETNTGRASSTTGENGETGREISKDDRKKVPSKNDED